MISASLPARRIGLLFPEFRSVGLLAACLWTAGFWGAGLRGASQEASSAAAAERSTPTCLSEYRSPIDLAIVGDGRWVVTANATSDTASLIDRQAARVADERPVGRRPVAVAAAGPHRVLVVASEEGDLVRLDIEAERLVETGRLHLGAEPRGVAVAPGGATAFVTLSMAGSLAIVDLDTFTATATIDVGRLPRGVAVSPDGRTVAVACAAGAEIVLVAADTRAVRSRHPFHGINVGPPVFTADGTTLFFPWTYEAGSHPSKGNIRRGWVTGSRLGRLDLAAPAGENAGGAAAGEAEAGGDRLRGLTLDVSGEAVGDVACLVVAEGVDDPRREVFVTAGGTHELLCLTDAAIEPLPYTQISGSEVMPPGLAADRDRFRRLELGGRPQGIRLAPTERRAVVANYLLDAVQEVDLDTFDVVGHVPLSAPGGRSPEAELVRQGEAIFLDARRSLDQWYSCHTCHFEGGGNTVTFDTLNDASAGTPKTALPLYRLADTGPWTWHGWQDDLRSSLRRSLVETMQGPEPTAADVEAVLAYLARLEPPPSPFREAVGEAAAAIARGEALFHATRTACATCHAGPLGTSPENHDVGLGRASDRYPGFSPPILAGLYRKTIFLHHGRTRSLEAVLAGPHGPDRSAGLDPLTDDEVRDLAAYLRTR
jgi:YVTN family beta-propeller protein